MIRKYSIEDNQHIVDLWYKASKIAHHFLGNLFLKHEERNITEKYLPATENYVFEKEGKVVGFISLMENEIGGLFVHPDYQKMGIGNELVNYAFLLKGNLFLDVFKKNEIGKAFYFKYGFQFEKEILHEETGEILLRLNYSRKK